MAFLDIERLYENGDVLLEIDLDAIQESITDFLNVTRVSDDNLATRGITGSTKVINLSVTTDKLASDAVTTTKILDANVTEAKLAADSISTDKFVAVAVTEAKLASGAVTTDKIADEAVTPAKREAHNDEISTAGSLTTTSTSEQDIPSATVTITTTGKPVLLYLQKNTATNESGISTSIQVATTHKIRLYRDVALLGMYPTRFQGSLTLTDDGSASVGVLSGQISALDVVSAGTYTYKATFQAGGAGGASCELLGLKLVAVELV